MIVIRPLRNQTVPVVVGALLIRSLTQHKALAYAHDLPLISVKSYGWFIFMQTPGPAASFPCCL